jgi:hypothetical protein
VGSGSCACGVGAVFGAEFVDVDSPLAITAVFLGGGDSLVLLMSSTLLLLLRLLCILLCI